MSYDFTGSSYSIEESEKHIAYLRHLAIESTRQANALQQFVDVCKEAAISGLERISSLDGHASHETIPSRETAKNKIRGFSAAIESIIEDAGRNGISLDELEDQAKERRAQSKAKSYRQAIMSVLARLKPEKKIESMGKGRYRAVRPRNKKTA